MERSMSVVKERPGGGWVLDMKQNNAGGGTAEGEGEESVGGAKTAADQLH